MPSNPAAPEQSAPQEPLYPTIERFAETATRDEVQQLFGGLRSALEGLKGPQATHAAKVTKAVERTEALLSSLLDVRDKLEAERKQQRRR